MSKDHIPGFEFTDIPATADVVFLANDYDVTSSAMKGADKAPAAIKEMFESQIETRERYTGLDMSQKLKWHWHDMGATNNLSPEDMVNKTKEAYESLGKDKFIIGIGGDHSTALGLHQSLAEREDPKNITILYMDAHFDLRNIDEFRKKPYGGCAHCCTARRAAELGYNLVFVGTRDYSEEELEFAKAHQDTISFFELGKGDAWPIDDVLKAIKTEKLYISLDVDVFDPAVFPITGTQVPGGISWDFGIKLLQKVITNHTLIGADICETAVSETEPFATYRTIFSAAKLAYIIPTFHYAKTNK